MLTFIVLLFAGASTAVAQNTPLCPADSGGKILGCTAQDISIALVSVRDDVAPPGPCLVGSDVPLELQVQFGTNAASDSRDVATWFALDQGNLLLTSGPGSTGAANCVSKALTAPIPSDDQTIADLVFNDPTEKPTDACGDVRGIKGQSFTDDFPPVLVKCDAAAGGAEVDALVSWHEKSFECSLDDATSYGGFNHSKCNLSTTFFDLDTYGKLTILKAASIDDVSFSYTSTGTVSTDDLVTPIDGFDLLTNGPGYTVAAQTGQAVTITETLFDDWAITDISCVNNDPRAAGVPVVFQRQGNSLLITLTEGNLATDPVAGTEDYGQSDVTCTFTNSVGGSITVIKDTVPNGPQDFGYTGTYEPDGEFPPFDFGGGFSLDDDADDTLPNTAVFDNLDPGTYSLNETQVAGFALSNINCSGTETVTFSPSGAPGWQAGDTGVTFDITPGMNVVCTFVNIQQGGIVVAKQAFPEGSDQVFTFTGTASGDIMDDETIEVLGLAPGQYTSTEVLPNGWDLTSIVCDDNNSTGDVGTTTATFNVEPGETVTCTFLNTQRGNIILQKAAEGGDGTFTLELSGPESGLIDSGPVVTSGGFGQVQFNLIPASEEVAGETYAVSEVAQDGWELISTVCTGANDTEEDSAAIDLDPGETVTCIFTNTKDASVTLRKESQGFDDTFCWDYITPVNSGEVCMATNGGFAEQSSGSLNYSDGVFGNYSMVEQQPEGADWILVSATCSNGQDPANLEVGPGDDVICTFVNVMPGAVPVNNIWALLLLILMVMLTAWRFRPPGVRKV